MTHLCMTFLQLLNIQSACSTTVATDILSKMYGYRSNNGLMTNLDSISSSLSSIDTIGQRTNVKASVDNLITSRSHSITSTSLLWRGAKANGSVRNATNHPGSEIYHNRRSRLSTCCLNLETALHFLLVPSLMLVITRQVFDFLGQIWLQIIINFITILLIIVALFGIRQRRLTYIGSFTVWALFNTVWNLIVFCLHSKTRDVGITEDALSFFTGSVSWWHSNGPGCMPYNFNPNQPPSLSIIQPNIIPGCRLDYHLIESTQAIIHGLLSFLAVLVSCCVLSNIHKEHAYLQKQQGKSFRLNNLTNERAKINQDPFPDRVNPRYGNSASLRRAANHTSTRSSQHSLASTRRRNRHSTDGAVPGPRESVSSMHKSQKYGSLSSRRSSRKDRRSEISSLTYGTTGARGPGQRNRLSSMSSNDYLPSYQPPASSNANLLSSYGEISSIDSYNNTAGNRSSRGKASNKSVNRGNTNPTYNGSRSSVCSQNATNYDDLSYIYGNNGTRTNESIYGPSTSGADAARQRRQMYHQNRGNTSMKRNGISEQYQSHTEKIHAETHRDDTNDVYQNAVTNPKTSLQNGNLHSFSVPNSQIYPDKGMMNGDYGPAEINNNQIIPNLRDEIDNRNQTNGTFKVPNSIDNRSRHAEDMLSSSSVANQNRIPSSQRSRHPIYSNHIPNGNSDTPI